MKTFLHVGCGPKNKKNTTPEFSKWNELRFDIDAEVAPDVIGSMTDMSSVESGTVDAVFSSHNIEHLYPHEIPIAFAEFHRVLNHDGFIVITCPDLQSVCQLIAEDKLLEPAYISPAGPIAPLDILYGHRPQIAKGNHFMAHKSGFTQSVLSSLIKACGFKSVASLRRAAPYFDLWIIGTKSEMTEDTLRLLASNHFPVK